MVTQNKSYALSYKEFVNTQVIVHWHCLLYKIRIDWNMFVFFFVFFLCVSLSKILLKVNKFNDMQDEEANNIADKVDNILRSIAFI